MPNNNPNSGSDRSSQPVGKGVAGRDTASAESGERTKSIPVEDSKSTGAIDSGAAVMDRPQKQPELHNNSNLGKDDFLADIAAFPTEQPSEIAPSQPGAFAERSVRYTIDSGSPSSVNRPATSTSPRPQSPGEEDPSHEASHPIQAVLVSAPPAEFDNCQICMAACDSGKGWEACQDQCVPDATFHCENDTLGGMKTVQEYADFIALFGKACPDASWTTHSVHWDGVAHMATFVCTYHCQHTQSVPGLGPIVPTQKKAHSPYCYTIQTDPARDNKIVHINKIWNDAWMLRDLGWLDNSGVEKQGAATGGAEEGTGKSTGLDSSSATDPTEKLCPERKSAKSKSEKSFLRRLLPKYTKSKNK